MNVATTFTALAELCEQADGPRLDLDHAIHDLFPDGDGAPLYTRSIDAAMTLISEETSWAVGVGGNEPEHIWAWVGSPLLNLHHAATPALALCAAALRAQEQSV